MALDAGTWPLPIGLCGNREDHDPHEVEQSTLGPYQCHADQTKRMPAYGEKMQKARRIG